MLTHEEPKAKALSDPKVLAEYERLEREEMPMLDAILKARAKRGSDAGRGCPSPSLATHYLHAAITDENFLRKINAGEESFTAGDILVVKLRQRQ